MKELKKIGQRLRDFMDHKDIGINEMGKICNTSGAQIHHIVNGRNYGMVKLINIIKSFDDLNVEWLLTGEGQMLSKGNTSKKSDIVKSNEKPNKDLILKNSELEDKISDLNRELSKVQSQLEFQNLIIEAHKKTIQVQEASLSDLKLLIDYLKNKDLTKDKKKSA